MYSIAIQANSFQNSMMDYPGVDEQCSLYVCRYIHTSQHQRNLLCIYACL